MRYILGVLGVILVLFIAIILITSRGSGSNANSSKKVGVVNLMNYDNGNSAVKMTIQGRLVGEQQRQSISVTVTQNQRTIALLNGYEENVAKSATYTNTPKAYSTFLQALKNANYTKKRNGVTNDESGYCPTGNRYIYEISEGGKQVQRLWGSSCAATQGTFAGDGALTRVLFRAQIASYDQFVVGTFVIY